MGRAPRLTAPPCEAGAQGDDGQGRDGPHPCHPAPRGRRAPDQGPGRGRSRRPSGVRCGPATAAARFPDAGCATCRRITSRTGQRAERRVWTTWSSSARPITVGSTRPASQSSSAAIGRLGSSIGWGSGSRIRRPRRRWGRIRSKRRSGRTGSGGWIRTTGPASAGVRYPTRTGCAFRRRSIRRGPDVRDRSGRG